MGHSSKPRLIEMPARSPSGAAALLPCDIEFCSAGHGKQGAPHPDDNTAAEYQAKRRAFIQALGRQAARELMAQTLAIAQTQD
jgi:hypothetical protein